MRVQRDTNGETGDAWELGFTVLELVLALSLLAAAVAGLGAYGQSVVQIAYLHEVRLDTQQAARRGMERVTEELRWAGAVVPDPGCGSSGLCANRVSVRIPAGNPYRQDQAYEVTFQYNPRQQEVERRVGRGVNNLASLIQGVTFTYFDADGAPAPSASGVVRVRVVLVAAGRGAPPIAIASDVALRNLRP
jgi:type II secretory pathway pseudopilin PulG